MKKIILSALVAMVLVACQNEYDKMSEYEKMVHDVGVSSKISAEDALKNVPLWKVAMLIESSKPDGQGKTDTSYYEGEYRTYGAYGYWFSFNTKLRMYVSYPLFGVVNLTHRGYYVDYEYSLEDNNSINVHTDSDIELYRQGIYVSNDIDKAKLVAYNEKCIIIETYTSFNKQYPYATYLLKPATPENVKFVEENTNNIDQFYIDNKHVFDEIAGRE